jgi:hypothetical protein
VAGDGMQQGKVQGRADAVVLWVFANAQHVEQKPCARGSGSCVDRG